MVAARAQVRAVGQGGFTLLELMVTLIVTLIGMAGLLQLHTSMARANEASGRQLEASGYAEQALEQLRSLTLAELITEYSALPIDEDYDTVSGRNGVDFTRHVSVIEVSPAPNSLIRLRVEVSWTDNGAVEGSADGIYDHTLAVELLRAEQGAQ